LAAIAGYNVIGLFHGHQHETAMIYRGGGLDLFKPKAAFMGGFAVARVAAGFFDVVLAEAAGGKGVLFSPEPSARRSAPAVDRKVFIDEPKLPVTLHLIGAFPLCGR
jgi:cytolysin (calcineurin-like family phosphatase)